MMLYRNTNVKVRSLDGDTDYFDIVANVLQGDTLAPYLFIICQDYVLRTSIDKIKENGFKLTKERSRRYLAKTITNADYANDIALLANAAAQAETLLHSLKWATAGISLHVNAHEMEYMCFNQTGDISTLNGSALKTSRQVHLPWEQCLINQDNHRHMTCKGLTDKIKCSFFHAVVISILLYGCTMWTLTKHMEKKFDSNYMRMLRAILNKSWRQHPTKDQLYSHRPPVMKTIKIRWTRHAGHC